MGLLGRVIGGALQGAGAGMTQQAEARRQQAMEMLRQQFQTQQADVANERQVARDDRVFQQQNDLKALDYKQDVAKIAMTGQVQERRDAAQHNYTLSEIGAKTVSEKQLSAFRSNLDTKRDAASIRLKDQLDSGDVKEIVTGKDGNFWKVTQAGDLVNTGIAAAPTAAEQGATGGGRLTEGEQQAAFDDDRKAWRAGGKKGAEPKRSDYIGMTREAFSGRGSAPAAAEAPARRSGGGLLANPFRQDEEPAYSPDENAGLAGRLGMPMPRTAAAVRQGQTYTLAQLREFAKQSRMSEEEARAWARAQGFRITGAK